MSQVRSWLPKILIESLLIVLSILLALAVDEWREQRQTGRRVAQALESFAGEIQRNRKAVAAALPYHERLHDHLQKLTVSGKIKSSKDLTSMEGFRGFWPVPYESSAWRTAVATGIVTDLDFKTAAALSRLYTAQDEYAANQKTVFGVLQPSAFTEEALPMTVILVDGYLVDTVFGERELLQAYDAVLKYLERLKAPPPS